MFLKWEHERKRIEFYGSSRVVGRTVGEYESLARRLLIIYEGASKNEIGI